MSRFDMFEVSIPHIIYAALGAFVVIFGMFSLFIREKLYIGEACWAFLFGVVIGPYGANIFNPRDWGGGNVETTNTITLEFCRVVLAIGVFAIGVELPKAYMARHWKSLFFLLFPVMTWGWFVSAGLIYALIPGLNFLSSLAVAACLTPTDPILAAAVVGGKYADKHVPAHLRHLLAAESGCNDGAAFPFLFISLYLINDGSVGKAVGDWFLFLWLYQIILGAVLGAIIGFAFRHLMKFCERTDLIDRQSYVAQYVSLAMLTIGINTLLGSDDLLAAFSCGSAFAWDGFFNRQTEQAVFSSVIDLLFNIASFVFIGAWMPFDAFSDSSLTLSVWRLIVIAILVLLLRRLPIMIALYKWIPDVKTFREAIFSGHFGPMGVGAVFISTLAAGQLPKPEDPPANQRELLAASIQPIVAFMVLCSITIHGLSIPFFSLGRRVHSVTRTWSRHDTFGTFTGGRGAMPEWTTHTRQVRPGEEIVINRDREDAMERGVAPAQEDSVTEKEHSESSQERDYAETRRPDGTDVRDENAPDGDDLEEEWREGPHRILEKRAGPGEEVEVEVQRNFYGPEPTATDTVRVAEDAAEHVVGEIKQRVGSGTQELESIVENAQRNIQEGASHVEGKAREMEGRAQEGGRHFMSILQGEGEDEADEGWMSDASDGGRRPEGKRRIKKPNRKKGSIRRHPGSHRGPQRSASIDQAGLSEAHKEEQEKHDAGSESPEERRGRNSPEPEGAVTPASSMRYPRVRHSRVDSIRTDLRSREQSPSRSVRSVRFADQRSPSGYNTPRIFSPSSPATPLPGSEAPSEDEAEQSQNNHHSDDSPRNVRFSLPDIRR